MQQSSDTGIEEPTRAAKYRSTSFWTGQVRIDMPDTLDEASVPRSFSMTQTVPIWQSTSRFGSSH